MMKHWLNVLLMCLFPDGGTKGAPVMPESAPMGGAADLSDVIQMPSNKTMLEHLDMHELKQ